MTVARKQNKRHGFKFIPKLSPVTAVLLLVALLLFSIIVYKTILPSLVVKDPNSTLEELASLGYVQWGDVSEGDLDKSNVTYFDRMLSEGGFNLYNSRDLTEAHLMDMEGNVVHRWSAGIKGGGWHQIELSDGGDLFARINDVGLMKLSWNSTVIWEVKQRFHHDLALAENNDIYILSRNILVINYSSESLPILDDQIVVLSPDGELKRNISVYRLIGGKIPQQTLGQILRKHKDTIQMNKTPDFKEDSIYDVFHANSLEILDRDLPGVAKKGDLLICARNINLIAIVDLDNESVVWSWGEDVLDAPHQPTLTKNNTILVFDNGRNRGYSRIVEVNPLSREVIWEYKGTPETSFNSKIRGGVQELLGGNILITESEKGHAFEITKNGTIVWDYWNPDLRGSKRAVIYRMRRFTNQELQDMTVFDSYPA